VNSTRARFIRLQIELARGGTPDEFLHRTAEIVGEIDALAAQWARAWLAELPPRVAKAIWKQQLGTRAFRRGFVDGVTLGADVFLWAAPELFALVPLTELHLHGGYSDVNALLASPHLRRLRAVRLSGGWDGDRLARRLGKVADLGAVRELDLSHCRITDLGALDLAWAAALRNLTLLRLRCNRLYERGVYNLADAPALAALTRLDVTGNPAARWWTGPRSRNGKQLLY
jgi:hypothetical protein